jgi:formylglycine-generating enzyme required for sulfatase activity
MHGNVWEWVRDPQSAPATRRSARGGSWSDRPQRATSAAWISYPEWQRVHNVGFRVACEE